ncbi:hypothetical protein JCM33374_g1633 [Metschnikowia sp. JCM 33374]|nr:hypothetical protein JCM33374_g1633 [Metschnikowia sp. JCM 33374]
MSGSSQNPSQRAGFSPSHQRNRSPPQSPAANLPASSSSHPNTNTPQTRAPPVYLQAGVLQTGAAADSSSPEYSAGFRVAPSAAEENDVVMNSDTEMRHVDDADYGETDQEHELYFQDGANASQEEHDHDDYSFAESRDDVNAGSDVVEEDEDDEEEDEDEEEEDEEEDDEEDEDLDDDDSGLYGFMSGGQRGASFLRELVERNRAAGGPANSSNILEAMQRLVDGLEGPSFGRQHSEFDSLISNISQRDDTYLILESINELSEKLLMMDGMTAERVIAPAELASALVNILTDPLLVEDLELHLVTCRCLYNFIEVNTDFINDALNSEAVETLVSKLLDIVYIDLTEQCLQTLEIMSRDSGSHSLILESDGLKACLQNLDFLTVHSQRKCLQIVANACEDISAVYFDFVLDQFQNLVTVAQHHDDAAVKKSAWLGVSRIIESFKDKPDFLEKLFSNDELLSHMLGVIRDSCNPSSTEVGLNYHSMISLLKSLIILISTSVKISNLLLNLQLGDYIKGSLNKFKKSDDAQSKNLSNDDISIESLISCPKELLSLFLTIIAYFSPITYSPKDSPFLHDDYKVSQTKNRINYDRNLSYRNENAQVFRSFTTQIWPVLVGSFQATMDYAIRKQALISISRIVSFSHDSDYFSKKDLDSLIGILTSIVSSGKQIVSKATETPSTNERSLKGSMILLSSACLIIQNLLFKSQLSCVHILEREGVFNDLSQITEILKTAGLGNDDEEIKTVNIARNQLSNAFSEKFADKELVDSNQQLDWSSILKHLEKVAITINTLHDDFANSGEKSISENNKLESIFIELGRIISDSSAESHKWAFAWHNLAEALSSREGGISSFELSSSGLLGQLTEVFQGKSLSKKSHDVATETFIQVFYEDKSQLARLILLLQDSLARAESFEVISSGVQNQGGTESGAASLAKQIKIRLISDDDPTTDGPSAREQIIISVHSIATFKAIDKFLKQKRLFAGLMGDQESNTRSPSQETLSEGSEGTKETTFLINGTRVSKDSTVFGAIFKSLHKDSGLKKFDTFDIWGKPHEVFFRTVPLEESIISESQEDVIEPIDGNTESILKLLRVFFMMNEEVEKANTLQVLPTEIFMNWKLTVKLNRQLEEPLIVASGSMPSWSIVTTNHYPFVYPLNTRMFFLQSTSFGHSRLIHNWNSRAIKDKAGSGNENSAGSSGTNLSLGAPVRKKVRLSRERIFKSAIKVLHQFGSSPPILEIEYFDEVGSGLGPTLEFYASVSKAFCKKELGMWRHGDLHDEYAVNTQGLFPAPLNKGESNQGQNNDLFLFKMLGVFIARALLDSRIIDFNFNTLFISLIQDPHYLDKFFSEDRDVQTQINLLQEIDSDLARSMHHLTKYLEIFKGIPDDEVVEVDGMKLSDLSLYFILPGYSEVELIPDGGNIAVNPRNLEVYIRKVAEYFLISGVTNQVNAFREGFSSVFPIESLSIFTAKELKDIFGSGEEDWSRETISESIKANHGYAQDSRAISMLVNVMQDLSISERREFLQFLTGSPRLPIGGFKAMRPEFTVVRKHPDAGLSGDDYLPSVMTCANYLKLPDYTSETLMKSKLLHAMREGAGAFHLS